jgi:hypothetical protein
MFCMLIGSTIHCVKAENIPGTGMIVRDDQWKALSDTQGHPHLLTLPSWDSSEVCVADDGGLSCWYHPAMSHTDWFDFEEIDTSALQVGKIDLLTNGDPGPRANYSYRPDLPFFDLGRGYACFTSASSGPTGSELSCVSLPTNYEESVRKKKALPAVQHVPLDHPGSLAVSLPYLCALERGGVRCGVVSSLDKSPTSSYSPIPVPSLVDPTGVYILSEPPAKLGLDQQIRFCALERQGLNLTCWDKDGILLPEYASRIPLLGLAGHQRARAGKAFLRSLSNHLYSFDQQYLNKLAALAERQADPELATGLVLAALMPQLEASGYTSIQKHMLDPALNTLAKIAAPVEQLAQNRRMTIEILATLIETAAPVYSASQKSKATQYLAFLADALASGSGQPNTIELGKLLPKLHGFFTELSQNPYLTGRAASGLQILHSLEGAG